MRRVLILSCSQRKRPDADLLPARERYDGPSFRVLRRYLRDRPDPDLEVFVLSAEYGLISANRPILDYDRRMTRERAAELRLDVRSALVPVLGDIDQNGRDAGQLLVVLGKVYLEALDRDWQDAKVVRAAIVPGALSAKVSQLRDWLYGEPAAYLASGDLAQPRRICLRGVELTLTGEKVLALASRARVTDPAGAAAYRTWCVHVDGGPVAPKWLVSQITGLAVDRFTTSEALALLARLGIPASRP